jgi:hypothetical protein
MKLSINENNKPFYSDAVLSDEFSPNLFHDVQSSNDENLQVALHTNIGSFTVLDRMTGFGWRDIETGYRAINGDFWLASGGFDVRDSSALTLREAIEWVKSKANTCIPKTGGQA